MTVVITLLASDNAKNRRRARRAAERESTGGIKCATLGSKPKATTQAVRKPFERVVKAVSSAEGYGRQLQKAIGHHEPIAQKREEKQRREHMKVRNPLGQQVNARQKMRGKSIPLI
ncbi:hypothetical protein [Chimaeribacter arupi]|uniref:hypothetical protein n=1 Tax=Chimaeribacter arupi TaxID=2060066 RepID=UPI0013FCF76F|nr:hypothetical protein [Chimaeribacter arupi]